MFIDPRTATELRVLSEISFQVPERELVAIIGPSGCGKTTLLRIVAGLEEASSGRVLLTRDGHTVERRGPGPECGMVFQEHSLFPWRTARENIEFGLEFIERDAVKRQRIALDYLRLANLEKFADRYPSELSGGMRQRVAIARALATNPEVLLLDEPFAALDVQSRRFFQDELLRIWEATRKTIVLVTHSIEEAVYLADRVIVLDAHPGRVIEIATITDSRRRDKTSPAFVAIVERLWQLIASTAQRHANE
jgi:NitT/TauT family transport system ATP-binding protein